MSGDLNSDFKATSRAWLDALRSHRESGPWYARAWDRWFKRRVDFEMSAIQVLAAIRDELMREMDARAELERKLALRCREEQKRIDGASEDSRQLRIAVSALHAGVRAVQDALDRESILRLSEREEDRALLARFTQLAEETRANLRAAEQSLRALSDRHDQTAETTRNQLRHWA